MKDIGIVSVGLIGLIVCLLLLDGLGSVSAIDADKASTDQNSVSYSMEAWDHYYDKDLDKAIELFKEEVKLHPDWCDPYDGLGWCYLQKGDFLNAQDNFQKSLKIYAYYPNSLAGMAEVTAWKYRRFNRAWATYYAGGFEKAIGLFNEVLSGDGSRLPKEEFWRAQSGLAWSYVSVKEYDKAIQNFQEVLKVSKDNYDATKGLGMAYFEKEDWENSLANLEASLKLVAYQPDVQSKIAWIYNKKTDYAKAIEEFEKAMKLNPYLVEPYKGLAWTYYALGDLKKAKEFFNTAIKIYPGYIADQKFKDILKANKDWSDLIKTLAWSYYTVGLYKEAGEEFKSAAQELGDDADILRGLGYTEYKLGQYDKAIEYFNRSLAIDSTLPPVSEYVIIPGTIATYAIKSDAQSSLAWALYYKGKYDEAIAEFEKVLAKHADWIDAHDGLGWAGYMKKDNVKAEKAFRDALTLNPGYADALNGLAAIDQAKYGRSGLGWSYYYQGNYKAALKQFADIVKGKDPNFPKDQIWSIHDGMGWCHYWSGSFEKAQKEFELVLSEKADNVDAMVGLGYVLFARESYSEAIEKLNSALKVAPYNYDALTRLGWSYYKTGDYAKAIDQFKKAIEINVYLVDPYFGLGLSYYRNKNMAEAKETLGIAIDIYPDYVLTDEFKKILEKDSDKLDSSTRFGWSYYYKGLYDKASEMFATELKRDSNSTDALLGLGSIFYQQGDYKATISKLEPLLSGKPETEKGWLKWSYVLTNLGWSHYNTGNYDKALAYFDQLVTLHKDDVVFAEPYSGQGWCLLKKGDKKAAKEKFLEAVRIFPGYISAVNGLAQPEMDQI